MLFGLFARISGLFPQPVQLCVSGELGDMIPIPPRKLRNAAVKPLPRIVLCFQPLTPSLPLQILSPLSLFWECQPLAAWPRLSRRTTRLSKAFAENLYFHESGFQVPQSTRFVPEPRLYLAETGAFAPNHPLGVERGGTPPCVMQNTKNRSNATNPRCAARLPHRTGVPTDRSSSVGWRCLAKLLP